MPQDWTSESGDEYVGGDDSDDAASSDDDFALGNVVGSDTQSLLNSSNPASTLALRKTKVSHC